MSLKQQLLVKYQYNMNSIDITDLAFTLDDQVIRDITNVVDASTNNIMYIYIGLVALAILVGIYIYKNYINNKNEDLNENCADYTSGFCPLNSN